MPPEVKKRQKKVQIGVEGSKKPKDGSTKKRKKSVTFDALATGASEHEGASINKLMEVAQTHMSTADTERLESITESLPIAHAESQVTPANEAKNDRSITRDLAKKNLRKWNFFVRRLNEAENVQFPLRSDEKDITLHSMASISAPVHAETSLERKLNEIYERSGIYAEEPRSEQGYIPLKKVERANDEQTANDLDPDAYVTTPNILAKLKAAMSYDVKKRQRANKIKSKQYHRMQRKEEDKAREAMIKKMYEIDPKAAALRQKQHLEKQRAYERATMRHKNTSKYIKHIKRAAMWDSEKREALDKQHEIYQKNTAKDSLALQEDSASDQEATEGALEDALTSNPLPQDFINKSREGLQQMSFMQRKRKNSVDEDDATPEESGAISEDSNAISGDDEPEGPRTAITRSAGRFRAEKAGDQQVAVRIPHVTNAYEKVDASVDVADPEPPVKSAMYPTVEEQRKEQEALIQQAFADEEILENLIKEKEAAIEKEAKPVDTNQALPGWNEWGGAAEEDSSLNKTQKARMARLEAKRKIELDALRQKRRDNSLQHVFINESAEAYVNPKFVAKKVPYPYSSQEQYEESVRLPLGKEWNAATVVEKLTTPPVRTKKGKIIEPLDSGVRRRNTPRTKIRR